MATCLQDYISCIITTNYQSVTLESYAAVDSKLNIYYSLAIYLRFCRQKELKADLYSSKVLMWRSSSFCTFADSNHMLDINLLMGRNTFILKVCFNIIALQKLRDAQSDPI